MQFMAGALGSRKPLTAASHDLPKRARCRPCSKTDRQVITRHDACEPVQFPPDSGGFLVHLPGGFL